MVDAHSHSEPQPEVAGYVLGTLYDDETAAFASHLATCDPCRSEVERLAGLPVLLADVADPWTLPSGLEERTFRAIDAAASRTSVAHVVPITAARRRPRPLVAVAVAIAAAAAGSSR